MHLAYITSHYARASDTFVRNEVIELRRRGHDVTTFSIRRETTAATLSDVVKDEQAHTTYILEQGAGRLLTAVVWALLTRPGRTLCAAQLAWQTRVKGMKGLFLQLAYLTEAAFLARCLVQARIQILHNHIAENSASVAMLASILSGVPFSMTVHGPGIFYHPRQWALGEKIARSAFTVAITHFCKSQCMLFSEALHWPRIHVVRCSAGTGFFAEQVSPPSATPRFLFVGRLCAEKGLSILIEAFSKAQQSGIPMQLVVIGDGPLRAEVERTVASKQLAQSITLMGAQPSSTVQQELARCSAFVLPSFAEGLPVSIMEAFAMGRPVISTQIAAIPELVQHGKNGWLVAPGSVDELCDVLIEAARIPPETLAHMGADAAARVKTLHNFGHEMDKLEALLAQHRNLA